MEKHNETTDICNISFHHTKPCYCSFNNNTVNTVICTLISTWVAVTKGCLPVKMTTPVHH